MEMFENKAFTKMQEKVTVDLDLDNDIAEALIDQAQQLNCDVEDIIVSTLRDVMATKMTLAEFQKALKKGNYDDHINVVDNNGTVIFHFDRVYGFDAVEENADESVRS